MSYKVKDYMSKEVNTINSEATIVEGAKVMASDKNSEGYVLVLESGKPIGIVTEKDVVIKALARELKTSEIKITEIMSAPLLIIDPDDDLLDASRLMQEKNVRKLVVMRDEIIYGIITAKKIAQRCGEYVDRSIRDIIRWTTPLGI